MRKDPGKPVAWFFGKSLRLYGLPLFEHKPSALRRCLAPTPDSGSRGCLFSRGRRYARCCFGKSRSGGFSLDLRLEALFRFSLVFGLAVGSSVAEGPTPFYGLFVPDLVFPNNQVETFLRP